MHIEFDEREGRTRLRFRGNLTEEFDYPPLLPRIPDDAVFDLSGVRRINSAGVKHWIRFMRALGEDRCIRFEHCSLSVVEQLAVLSDFAGSATIDSFELAYLCSHCGASSVRFVSAQTRRDELLQPQEPCTGCGGRLDVDNDDALVDMMLMVCRDATRQEQS